MRKVYKLSLLYSIAREKQNKMTKNKIKLGESRNKSISVDVFDSGTTFISQFDVDSIKIGEWEKLNESCDTLSIDIYTTENKWVNFTLFRNREK